MDEDRLFGKAGGSAEVNKKAEAISADALIEALESQGETEGVCT